MSQSWRYQGGKLDGPTYLPNERRTPRAALATAEFRCDEDGNAPEIAFRLTEMPRSTRGWCVEVRRGCEVCATYWVTDHHGCWVYASVCACCLPCDVYEVVLVDDKHQDCASAYLDLMKSEGYGRAEQTCTCGGHDG